MYNAIYYSIIENVYKETGFEKNPTKDKSIFPNKYQEMYMYTVCNIEYFLKVWKDI